MKKHTTLAIIIVLLLWQSAMGQDAPIVQSRQKIVKETMKPYAGPSNAGVDASTLTGKVMCGYQGWHAAEGDGLGRGWYHWQRDGQFQPGFCKFDLWPDVGELDPDERYATAFRHADGSAAEVYSAFNRKTVLRHFQWMRQYGIDGVFVQRFVAEVSGTAGLLQFNTVLGHCREGANLNGRTYAVMYDLSGLGGWQMERVMDDWKLLIDRMQITRDKAYLHHKGKPVVAIWGFGFNDGRKYTPAEGLELVRFMKDDPKYGGNTVMLGVPTYWRTRDRDAVNDPALGELILKADVVSPWTVGRYRNIPQAEKYAENTLAPDLAWCNERGKEYMPVVFPGFSWHNMFPKSPLNEIPRQGGKFLWAQYAAAKKAGCTMVYQAMFDEVDEGTAIYKCSNDPPAGESKFVTYEGLSSDYYLKLVGAATRMIAGKRAVSDQMPDNFK
ncbi:MAG: glycoside hydrolase family 71/99-like protein [Thermoguttaceae bacterium]|jgi:hypothetical protein